MRRRLVLASTSRWRRGLLDRLGLPFEVAAPDFVETAPAGLAAAEVARRFAAGKAESLAVAFPDALIIGSDQVLELDGERLRKPGDLAAASAQLRRLAGRTHHLHTAVALHDAAGQETVVDAERIDLTVLPLTETQIRTYVRQARPVGSVGGYTIEGRGVALFERVVGGDESAVIGLPLITLCRLLRGMGIEPLDAEAQNSS